MEFIEYLFESACERCENGKFGGCDSYLSCPVYALYCEAKKLIKEKTRALSIDVEKARITEHRAFIERITKAFEGTEYEKQTDKIIRFIEDRDAKTPRLLYTGSMHEFGREDGRAIYKVLKQVV